MGYELDKVLELLGAINITPTLREYDELQAIKEWALESLGLDYGPGDSVVICSDTPWDISNEKGCGWRDYQEFLQRGKRGLAGKIYFDTYHKKWATSFITGVKEYSFHMDVHWLQKARD